MRGYKFTDSAEEHLDKLVDRLQATVKNVSRQIAKEHSNIKPIEVTAQQVDEAFHIVAKGVKKVPHYRFWHIVATLVAGIGVNLTINAFFVTGFKNALTHGSVGILLATLAIVVDSTFLDK